jgi:hypothetical protein
LRSWVRDMGPQKQKNDLAVLWRIAVYWLSMNIV